jgi:pimeloyl-ACP methyl ester carboxylesterase
VLVDAVGPTSDWMAALRRNVLDRLRGAQREAVAHISEESLGVPDAALHSAYSRAVYPAWFVDEQMASHFTPPDALSETGTAVLARLRRDGYDWRDIVHSISAPTLVLHGDGDALPLAVSETNSYIIPNARQIVVPSSGHMPFWEAPRRLFHEVESFLRQ